MGEYKYGTNFTSVRVSHAPGGASSINLGWDDPPNPNIRNSEKRQAVQDPFKSRESNRHSNEPEPHNTFETFQKPSSYLPPGPQKMAANPSYSQIKPQNGEFFNPAENVFRNTPEQNKPLNYFQNKEELMMKPVELPSGNYFRQPEGMNNYFRAPEGYSRQEGGFGQVKNVGFVPQGGFLMEKNFGKGQDVNYKEPERHMQAAEVGFGHRESPAQGGYRESPNFYGAPQGFQNREPQGGFQNRELQGGFQNREPQGGFQNREPQRGYGNREQQGGYGLPPRHAGRGQAPEAYGVQGFRGVGDGRGGNNYAVKNSVKVSNPPGGQSSFMFG